MLYIPNMGKPQTQHNWGTVGSTTPGTSVTTGAASTTKGTPVEVIASADFDACLVEIFASGYHVSAGDSRGCLDLLIGSATESVLAANLLMGACGAYLGANPGPKRWVFPIEIAGGSRLAVQAAGIRLSTAFRVQIRLYGGMISPWWRVGKGIDTMGIGTVPDGTAITPGASGAEGSWTQIVASTSRDYFCIVPSFQLGNDTNTNVRALFVDVGIGAATEQEMIQSHVYITGADESIGGPFTPVLPDFWDVPSGSRLTMRASNSGVNDAYQGALHGVY